jgi:hypothetical protein
MLVVNLFAGPGSGKSTGAAYVFSKIKMAGINAEIIPEYVKDKVWERADKCVQNQAYVFGKQYFRTFRLEGEVDVAITDSPLLLSVVYNNDPVLGEDFNKVVAKVANKYTQLNYFINRVKEYNPKGRFQTAEQSSWISAQIKATLDRMLISYKTVDGNQAGYDIIVEDILKYLKKN